MGSDLIHSFWLTGERYFSNTRKQKNTYFYMVSPGLPTQCRPGWQYACPGRWPAETEPGRHWLEPGRRSETPGARLSERAAGPGTHTNRGGRGDIHRVNFTSFIHSFIHWHLSPWISVGCSCEHDKRHRTYDPSITQKREKLNPASLSQRSPWWKVTPGSS